jgi:DNA-binding beta-propeller fold protein YncE
MEIREHTDLFEEGGFWRGLGGLITGGPDSRLVRPTAVAIHPSGGLIVADAGRQTAFFFDWSHRRCRNLGSRRPGGLPSPVDAIALRDGRILVSDSELRSIEAFSEDGRWLGSFVKAGILERPAGIAVNDERSELYVADVAGHAICVFDLQGNLLLKFGRRGAGLGELNFPTRIAVGPGGQLAVTDSLNFRVQLFSPEGKAIRTIGSYGDAPGQFSRPKGIAADSRGWFMVVEGLYDVIQFFDWNGAFLITIGSPGNHPGEFWLASGLAFDDKEHLLFVADTYNSRIQVFRVLGGPSELPELDNTP